MTLLLETAPPPLAADKDSVICITGTRVSLDSIAQAFQEGATPEEITAQYETLSLPSVYSVIAYYLQHRVAVEKYLRKRQKQAAKVRQSNETRFSPIAHPRSPSCETKIMLRFAADENPNGAIVRGLLRRNPVSDIVRVQDVGLMGADDLTVFKWAANQNRILLTQDVATITKYAL